MRSLMTLAVCALLGSSCDDASGPLFTETYQLVSAPRPFRGGTLVLEYRRSDAGTVRYVIDQPATAYRGSFQLRGDCVEMWLSTAHRTGDFDYDGKYLALNDGTKWKRVKPT